MLLPNVSVCQRSVWPRGLGGARRWAWMGLYWLGAALTLFGCARPHFDGVEYRSHDVSFQLGPLPPGMQEVRSEEARVTLENASAGTMVAIDARCGQEDDDVPLRALVQHLFLQFTSRELLVEKSFTLDERAALEMEITAELDGVSRHFIVIVLKKDGCVYDMYHVDRGGESEALRTSRDDFRKMARGFHTLR